jgi:uncharacterized protein (DUF927 family)
MEAREFLDLVWGDDGFYCIVAIKGEQVIQKFYKEKATAISAAENFDAEHFNTFFSTSTFKDGKTRKQTNSLSLKSFFLDIDCGVEKDYPTQAEAVRVLKNFCKRFKLPRPTIISSGRGLHVYWILSKTLTQEEWFTTASKLKLACRDFPFNVDTTATADSARVLRVPGTHNYKDDPPKNVEVLGEVGEIIDPEVFAEKFSEFTLQSMRPAFVPKEMDGLTEIISGSFSHSFKTILIKTQNGTGCAQIKHAVTNQEEMSEPMWRAALSVAAFCTDKDKAIHLISRKHPNYDPSETEQKANRIKGPYLCDRFEEYNPGGCDGCQHKGKIKSPIVLGREVLEATEEQNVVVEKSADLPEEPAKQYVIPTYPRPFFRGSNGGVWKRTSDNKDEPVEVLVYHNDIYITRRQRDPDIGETVIIRLHLPKDGVREFSLPLASILSKEELRKGMAAQGVATSNIGGLMEYLTRWVNELQTKVSADEARTQYGWTGTSESFKSFVIGRKEIFADRVEVNAPSSKTLSSIDFFRPSGTLEQWKEVMGFLKQPGFEMHQYVVGLGFGSVFMNLTKVNAAIFHAYSQESGYGKTAAMFAALSIWGKPGDIYLKENDTMYSRMNRAELYRHIMLPLDEMTNAHPEELSNFAYALTGGKQRNRLGQTNSERYRGEEWFFTCYTTGNTSMLQRIALYKAMPKAEMERILEYDVQKSYYGDKEIGDKFFRGIQEVYGHAGVPFIQYILNNQQECRELFSTVQKKFDKLAGLESSNRFWSAQAACGLTGLIVAKRAGLIDYDVSAVSKWLLNVIGQAKNLASSVGTNPEEALQQFISENWNNILRIKSTEKLSNGKINPGEDIERLIIPDASPKLMFVARYEYDMKHLFVFQDFLKTWCAKKQINYEGLISALKKGRTKAQRVKKRMSTGTRMNLPTVNVLFVDCSGFMEDDETVVAEREAADKFLGS